MDFDHFTKINEHRINVKSSKQILSLDLMHAEGKPEIVVVNMDVLIKVVTFDSLIIDYVNKVFVLDFTDQDYVGNMVSYAIYELDCNLKENYKATSISVRYFIKNKMN